MSNGVSKTAKSVQSTKPKSPAAAAAAEAADEPIIVDFRGQKFMVPLEVLASMRLRMLLQIATDQNAPEQERITAMEKVLPELLNPSDWLRFIDTCKRGESEADVVEQFFAAMNEAGSGNSSAS